MKRTGRTGSSRRAGWALTDQALSSLTNLVLSLLVARRVDADAFGAFGLAFTIYLLLIGATRAVTAEPLLVRFSDVADGDRQRAAGLAMGTAVAIGVVAGSCCVGVGLLGAGATAGPFVVLGVCLPGLLVQDTVRHVLFAAGRPRGAAGNDAVWAGALIVGLVVVLGVWPTSVTAITAAWGAAACLAALIGTAQVGVRPSPARARTWLGDHRTLIGGFLGEFAVRNGARYLTTFAVGAVAGLMALAGLRGAQVLFGPLNVLLLAVPLIAIPEAVRLHNEHPERLWPAMRLLSVGLAALGLLSGIAALAIPDSLGTALLGDSWEATRPVLLPQAALLASIGAVSGYLTGLRALAAPAESLVARLVMLPLGLVAGIGGALAGGAAGATAGMAAANWLAVGVWHVQFHRALRRRHGGGAVDPSAGAANRPDDVSRRVGDPTPWPLSPDR